MSVTLPPLPFAESALEPHISARTLEFHYGKHHQAYVTNLNNLIKDTKLASEPLETIIRESHGHADKTAVFNNAAQVWNHTFFWHSLSPKGGGAPTGAIAGLIAESFGSVDEFKTAFKTAAVGQFGSGWAWLVAEGGKLKIAKTANAETPIATGGHPLLTIDVWEHAYYLDYQNRRPDFVQTVLDHLINWDFANQELAKA